MNYSKKVVILFIIFFAAVVLFNIAFAQTPTPTPTPLTIQIIDNSETGKINVAGVWNTASSLSGYYATDYLIKSGGDGSSYVEYIFTIPLSGIYWAFLQYPANANNSNAVKVRVEYSGGPTDYTVNQTINGGTLNIPFATNLRMYAGFTYKVTIFDNADSSKNVIADAVKLQKMSDIPTVTPTPTPTPTISPTPSPTKTPTPTPSPTPSMTPTPTPGFTVTPSPTPEGDTPTPTPSPTPSYTPTASPTPSPSPTRTPTPSPSPTPSSPTPTPFIEPNPTAPPLEKPYLISKTKASTDDGRIYEMMFNDNNKHIYLGAQRNARIVRVAYKDIIENQLEEITPTLSYTHTGTYIYMSPKESSSSASSRYIGINKSSTTVPVVSMVKCQPDGSLTHVATGDVYNSCHLEYWEWQECSATRKGCVLGSPLSLFLPSDYSYIQRVITYMPYTYYDVICDSRLIAYLASKNFDSAQCIFQPANWFENPYSIYNDHNDIADLASGWGRILVPFTSGKMLVCWPNADGYVQYLRPTHGRVGGLEEVAFTDDQGTEVTPTFAMDSQIIFHPYYPLAFIADAKDSSIYMIRLDELDTGSHIYPATKFPHPQHIASSNDNTRRIAITGRNAEYIMSKSPTNSSIYTYKLTKEEPYGFHLTPASVVRPSSVTFNYQDYFVGSLMNGLYVTCRDTQVMYYEIDDDPDTITSSPLSRAIVPNGWCASLATDDERRILAVRNPDGNPQVANADVIDFLKISNWYFNMGFISPELHESEDHTPLFPLGGPVFVIVEIKQKDNSPYVPADNEVYLSYKLTGPQGDEEMGRTAMSPSSTPGHYFLTITPSKPGSLELLCEAKPNTKKFFDAITMDCEVSDKPYPIVKFSIKPKHVLIMHDIDRSANVVVSGEILWGMASTGYPTKSIKLTETNNNYKDSQPADSYSGRTTFSFYVKPQDLPYNKQLKFNLQAEAEKPIVGGSEVILSEIANNDKMDPICLVSDWELDKTLLAVNWLPPVTNPASFFNFWTENKDTYLVNYWQYNIPPIGDVFKFEIDFSKNSLTSSVPYLNQIEFELEFLFKKLCKMYSNYNMTPPNNKSTLEGSVEFKAPSGVVGLKVTAGGSVKGELISSFRPNCVDVIEEEGHNSYKWETEGFVGLETGASSVLIDVPLIGKAISKMTPEARAELDEVLVAKIKFSPNMVFNGYLYYQLGKMLFTRNGGDIAFKVEGGMEGEAYDWFKMEGSLSGQMSIGGKLDDFSINPALLPPFPFPTLWFNNAKLVLSVVFQMKCIKWKDFAGDITLLEYPASGGKMAVESPSLDTSKIITMPDYDKVDIRLNEKLMADDMPTTVVSNVYVFSAPFQLIQGNKKMIIYQHVNSDLPFEQSTDIYYLYFEDDTLVKSGAAWIDTRFQDEPTAVFTNDGKVILACKSMKIDNFVPPETDDMLVAVESVAPYEEIAYSVFDTNSADKNWTAPGYLTDNSISDYNPKLTIDHNSNPLLVFNSTTSSFIPTDPEGKFTINYSIYKDGAFSTPQAILADVASPIKCDLKGYVNKTYFVFSKDMDDDGLTTPDKQLYVMNFKGNPGVWDAQPTQLTFGAALNSAPHLLNDENGIVRLIWQKDDKIFSSVGEPLAQNPTTLLSGAAYGTSFNYDFSQVDNGDIICVGRGYAPSPDGTLMKRALFYNYVDPTTGTLGIQPITSSDSDLYINADIKELPDKKISALFLKRDAPVVESPGMSQIILGKTYMMLYNFTPNIPESYKISPKIIAPDKASAGTKINISIIPDRQMKIYSCDFKITVDDGVTISNLQATGALSGSYISADKKTAYIKRTGTGGSAIIPSGISIADLELSTSQDVRKGYHKITLSDEDNQNNYMTSSVSYGAFNPSEDNILILAKADLIDVLLGKKTISDNEKASYDINGDGKLDISDVVKMVNY